MNACLRPSARARARATLAFLLALLVSSTTAEARAQTQAFRVPPGRGGVARIDPARNRVNRVIVLNRPNLVRMGLGSTWVTDNRADNISVLELVAQRGPTWVTHKPADNVSVLELVAHAVVVHTAVRVGRIAAMVPQDMALTARRLVVLRGDAAYAFDPYGKAAPRRLPGLQHGHLLSAVATGYGAAWIVDATAQSVVRIATRSGHAARTTSLRMPIDGIAAGGGGVWLTSASRGLLIGISPSTGRVTRQIRVTGAATLAVARHTAWVASPRRNAVARVDLRSGQVRWTPVAAGPAGVAVNDTAVWVVNSQARKVTRLDPRSGRVVAEVGVPERPYWIAATRDSVWVTFLGKSVPHEVPEPSAREYTRR
jgi:hypothetical protein